jgi:S-(hydroxymethyl)glutathione dehydrogenase/alcohol dehydrogenase
MVRAAVLDEPGGSFRIDELALRPLAAGQVRVRIAATGLCRSDRSVQLGAMPQPFPVVLGHEAAGVVTECGAGVASPAAGDHVVLTWLNACRACYFCEHDHVELCEHGVDHAFAGPYASTAGGSEVWPGFGTATFAEETIVPAACAIPIDAAMPFELAALVGCGATTGMGAIRNSAAVAAGESVAIVGVGGVGLSAVQAAAHARAAPIIAVDRVTAKLELAHSCGATHTVTVTATSDPVAEVRAITAGRGVDHAVEVVGSSTTIRQAYDMARRAGTVTIVGAGRFDDDVAISAMQLMVDAKTIRGCVYGAADPARDIPAIVALHATGAVDLARLVSERITLDDLDTAFLAMDAGEIARSVVTFA